MTSYRIAALDESSLEPTIQSRYTFLTLPEAVRQSNKLQYAAVVLECNGTQQREVSANMLADYLRVESQFNVDCLQTSMLVDDLNAALGFGGQT